MLKTGFVPKALSELLRALFNTFLSVQYIKNGPTSSVSLKPDVENALNLRMSCLEVQAVRQRGALGQLGLDVVLLAGGAVDPLETGILPLPEQIVRTLKVELGLVFGVARPHDGRHGHEALPLAAAGDLALPPLCCVSVLIVLC